YPSRRSGAKADDRRNFSVACRAFLRNAFIETASGTDALQWRRPRAPKDQQSNCLRQLIKPWIAKGLTRYFTSCLVRKSAIFASVAKPVMKIKRSAKDGRISFAFR